MKAIIQIPCFNEERYLPATLADLPRLLPGIDEVKWLVIDDGSSDKTSDVALKGGVDYLERLPKHQGLAKTFLAGLNRSLAEGADIIINTDGDNQYRASYIAKLIEPLLKGDADIVIGTRPIDRMDEFSFVKKILQKLGSWVVRKVSGTGVIDAPCGFRAMNRKASMQINVASHYTYTLEMIIQAGRKDLKIACVDIGVNRPVRESRLITNQFSYVFHSAFDIWRLMRRVPR